MLWRQLCRSGKKRRPLSRPAATLSEPQENPRYFYGEERRCLNCGGAKSWRIVRKVSQAFLSAEADPGDANEGWATFWHYTILNHLYDEGKVTSGFMLEFLHSHTNVVFQPPL